MKKIVPVIFILTFLTQDLWAQGCSVCTQTAAGLGSSSAQGLNTGIVYLAALPLLFLGTVGFIWWKRNKALPEHND